jgi:uncharacterized membrane protein
MPLMDAPEFLSWVVIAALAVATCSFALVSWPLRALASVLGGTFLLAMLVEVVGVRLGVPFGEYSYTSSLQPQVLDVPVLVGLAWVAMLVPAWEIARRISSRGWIQAPICGVALVVWDLFLDPQMIGNGFWSFEHPSGWNGVPVSNAVGWFLTGTALSALPIRLLGRCRKNDGLAFLYTWMIGFSALGYIIPFALDDPEIGVVGAICSSPLLYLAWRRRERPWLA